jgi:hypothetical protein
MGQLSSLWNSSATYWPDSSSAKKHKISSHLNSNLVSFLLLFEHTITVIEYNFIVAFCREGSGLYEERL